MHVKRLVLLIIFFLTLFVSEIFASDATALAKLSDSQKLYEDRTDPQKVEQALTLLDNAEKETKNSQIQYDILLQSTRTIYWKARHITAADKKLATHEQGRAKSDQAKALLPDIADAYYWSAAHLSRWMEVSGVVESIKKKKELEDLLNAVLDRDTEDGTAGETFEYWGSDRMFGRVYFKAPPFAGGSLEQALKHLEKSYQNSKNYVQNITFYAEALYSTGKSTEKDRAKKILDDMLAQDPKTFCLPRVPETIEEFEEAKKLRAEMALERMESSLGSLLKVLID